MDLNHVAAFVRVVHDGSFTAAARRLGLPKSSVSRSIAQLEKDLGVVLLHRTTRKIHLTDAGAAFFERASRALGEIQEATSAASDLQKELRGSVRVSAPVDVGVWALAGIVARFARRHPNVTVDVRLSARIVDLAGEGFDLAVRAGPLRDVDLIARRVGTLELGLYASARYLARRGTPATLSELEAHDTLLLRTEDGPLAWRLTALDGAEVVAPTPRAAIVSDDISFLKKAVLAGGGIALLPRFLCGKEERSRKLVRVLPTFRLAGAMLHVVYPTARYVPQRVVAFRSYLVSELSELAGRCERLEEAHPADA